MVKPIPREKKKGGGGWGGGGGSETPGTQKKTGGGIGWGGVFPFDDWRRKTNMGFNDYWIVKIDSIGNKQWDKDYGGTDFDYLYSLQQTTDGGYILGGYSSSGIGGDKTHASWGAEDYWIVKIDSLGNKLWDKVLGNKLRFAFFHFSKLQMVDIFLEDILPLELMVIKHKILGGFLIIGL
ncbi:MAG: hypothetical protein IPG39_14535 [Bacteroidetes bacterium]|nr:hypothetical protein [Bacteroidota bacterium]